MISEDDMQQQQQQQESMMSSIQSDRLKLSLLDDWGVLFADGPGNMKAWNNTGYWPRLLQATHPQVRSYVFPLK